MVTQKAAASTHREIGEGGRGFEHAGEPLDFNANPKSAEYQPITVAEWVRNNREVIRVRLDRYNERETVDVRTWWRDAHGDMKPGRAGITLAIRHLPCLVTALNDALNVASNLGLVETRTDGSHKRESAP
jgi:hypothetical protein